MALSKLLDSKSSANSAGANAQSIPHSQTRIAEGVKIAGVISVQGDALIEGEVEGEVHCFGVLTLSRSAYVHGSVFAKEVHLEGRVNGDIFAEARIALLSPAHVEGNLSAPSLSIEDGVHFEGECIMKGSPISASSTSTSDRAEDKTQSDTSQIQINNTATLNQAGLEKKAHLAHGEK